MVSFLGTAYDDSLAPMVCVLQLQTMLLCRVYVVLSFKLSALCVLGKYSTNSLQPRPPPLFNVVFSFIFGHMSIAQLNQQCVLSEYTGDQTGGLFLFADVSNCSGCHIPRKHHSQKSVDTIIRLILK